jgi:hypothetical protein
MKRWLFILILSFCQWFASAQTTQDLSFPCYATATTTLNVRQAPWVSSMRMGQLKPGDRVVVYNVVDEKWGKIQYEVYNQMCYIHMDYVRLSPIPQPEPDTSSDNSGSWFHIGGVLGFLIQAAIYLFLIYLAFVLIAGLVSWASEGIAVLLTNILLIVNVPFRILNWLQRFLAKPWRVLIKNNRYSDSTNRALRLATRLLKVPLYVALSPLRFALACYYNLLIHCVYEWINYLLEVANPQMDDEGYNDVWVWTYMLPVRILKYLCWHGSLTLIESLIWTAVDTVLPALTLYHGTEADAAKYILSSPDRTDLSGRGVSHWMVGTGNFAGNGIYFAPQLSTARHYSVGRSGYQEDVVILCRVTLGRTLDLGLAPYRVYSACGKPNATIATQWGLNHGYVTGEWWRPDAEWWEYCMYDWKNRYNYSWRIRPIYVMPTEGKLLQRIPGGMHHWLFREIVWEDILQSLEELPDTLMKWWNG